MNYYSYPGLSTSEKRENKATISHLFDCAEELFGISREAITGGSRLTPLPDVRKILACFMVFDLGMTTTDAANNIGRDHSSVCFYKTQFDGLVKYDKIFKAKYDSILKMMHNKKLISYGGDTVKTYLDKLEAEKQIRELRNRTYER